VNEEEEREGEEDFEKVVRNFEVGSTRLLFVC